MPDTVDTVIWAPDDGWRYHLKHVAQLTDRNELYIVASCWTVIATYYTMHGHLNIKKWFNLICLVFLVFSFLWSFPGRVRILYIQAHPSRHVCTGTATEGEPQKKVDSLVSVSDVPWLDYEASGNRCFRGVTKGTLAAVMGASRFFFSVNSIRCTGITSVDSWMHFWARSQNCGQRC